MSEVTYCANGCMRNSTRGRIKATTEPPSQLCGRCEDNLRTWLREIPDRFCLLPLFRLPGSVDKNPEAKTGKRVDAPAPMRLEIVDLLDQRLGRKWQGLAVTADRRGVVGLLNAHAQMVRDLRNLQPLRGAPTITSETDLLARHLLWIVEQDWIADVYDEVKTLHHNLGEAIGIRKRRPVGSCVVEGDEGKPCGGPLIPNTYSGGVHCPRCGDQWDADELRRLGLLLTSGEAAS